MKRIFIFTLIILSVLMSCKQNSSTDNKNIDADSIALSDNIKPDTIIEGSELFFGERVVYSYDNRSNITEEITYDKDNIVQVRVQNYYDSKNNLIKSITNGTNIDDVEIEYKYDAKNRKIEEREKGFYDYTRMSYDDNNNLREEIYIEQSSGKVIRRSTYKYQDNKLIEYNQDEYSKIIYKYEGNNMIQSLSYDNIEKKLESNTIYEYDEKGNKTKEISYMNNSLFSVRSYIYDDNNNLIEENSQLSGDKHTIKYKYNSSNNKIEESFYSGDKLESKFIYKYDEQNRLKSITYYTKDILKYNDDCIVE